MKCIFIEPLLSKRVRLGELSLNQSFHLRSKIALPRSRDLDVPLMIPDERVLGEVSAPDERSDPIFILEDIALGVKRACSMHANIETESGEVEQLGENTWSVEREVIGRDDPSLTRKIQ